MINFINQIINGLSTGSMYALVAIGYTMVYGIAKMINFAHGDIIMAGAYFALIAMGFVGPIPAILFSIVATAALGVLTEKVAYKPLRGKGSLEVLITAFGVSYLLENVFLLIFGSAARTFPQIMPKGTINLGGISIKYITVITLVVTAVCTAVLLFFINKTKLGKAMRAVSEDQGAAQLMGINVNTTVSLTFAIGSGLAAVAGVLLCSTYPSLTPYTGARPGIKAFVAAVFGGIGSIPGAFIGGILLGIIEILSKAYISSQLADAIVFAVLIIVLLVKPTGLLGKKIQEKV